MDPEYLEYVSTMRAYGWRADDYPTWVAWKDLNKTANDAFRQQWDETNRRWRLGKASVQ